MGKKLREDVFKHHPKIGSWKKIVLALPLLLSLSWIFYLQYAKQIYMRYGVELLAPPNTTPLIIALIIFTIGYIIFLLLMFSDNIKEFFGKRIGH